jgi:hypothetical protein
MRLLASLLPPLCGGTCINSRILSRLCTKFGMEWFYKMCWENLNSLNRVSIIKLYTKIYMHLSSYIEYNSLNIFRSDRCFGQNLQVKDTIKNFYVHCIFQSNLKKYYSEIVEALREQMLHSFHTATPLLYLLNLPQLTLSLAGLWKQ